MWGLTTPQQPNRPPDYRHQWADMLRYFRQGGQVTVATAPGTRDTVGKCIYIYFNQYKQ